MMATETRRTRAEIAAATREAILSAACDVIADEGFEKIRMRMVADRAGVSTAALHYHFDTREKLFAEAMRHSFEHTGRDVYEARSGGDTATNRLARIISASLPTSRESSPRVGDVPGAVVPRHPRPRVADAGHRALPRAAGLDRGDAGRRHRHGGIRAVRHR